MRTFPFLSLLFLAQILFSQEERVAEGDMSPWEQYSETNVPVKAYTYVTDANLRDKPDANAKVLQKLPIATRLTIREVLTDTSTINGYRAPWCKVTTENGTMGYLWGGVLACATFTYDQEYDVERGLTYLVGVSSVDEKNMKYTMQIRAAKNGVEITRSEFQCQADVGHYVIIKPKGCAVLDKIADMVDINVYFPACGYGSSENLYFYTTGKKLIKAITSSNVSEAGIFFSSETVLTPCDKGGLSNHIVFIKESGEYKEGDHEFKVVKQEYAIELYKWNGSNLTKTKTLK